MENGKCRDTTGKAFRGDDLYNSTLNKVGVVLDSSNDNKIKVRTVSGEDYWMLSECEVLKDEL